jgi:hypothetical protein
MQGYWKSPVHQKRCSPLQAAHISQDTLRVPRQEAANTAPVSSQCNKRTIWGVRDKEFLEDLGITFFTDIRTLGKSFTFFVAGTRNPTVQHL